MTIQNNIDLLGYEVEDKVTGFKGIITSISFDLYGCVQAIVLPKVDKDAKIPDPRWFDLPRLKITSKKPVMEQPRFHDKRVVEGRKGAAEKPPFNKH